LIQGRVSVQSAGRAIDLHAGEQLVARPASTPRVARVDVNDILAWQNGRLVFDNEPLASVVARVSRYSKAQVAVGDPRAAKLLVSGVFNTGDIDGFVETITRYLPVEATHTENGTIWLRSKPGRTL
jgi:transmembrane sensor